MNHSVQAEETSPDDREAHRRGAPACAPEREHFHARPLDELGPGQRSELIEYAGDVAIVHVRGAPFVTTLTRAHEIRQRKTPLVFFRFAGIVRFEFVLGLPQVLIFSLRFIQARTGYEIIHKRKA